MVVNLAFIGLGAMGEPMARNLAASEHALTVYNRSADRTIGVTALGATLAASPAEAANSAEIVCTCVSTPEALRAVLIGENGAINGARRGTLFIDFSTVDPSTVRQIADACADRGCQFLEAPVSGGVKGATAGTLTIMVGGEESDLERAEPVLRILGQNVFRVGSVGSASAVKLINQMLVGVHLAAALQAFVAGQRAGVEPQVLYDVVTTSTGDSAMLRRGARNLFEDDFTPGFKLDLLLKDLRLATALGDEVGAPLTLAAAARQLYAAAGEKGLGDRDIAAAVLAMPWERLSADDSQGNEKT
jgi:3-hydroxyisobutyrate dehydrogenase-like beta-hydroxyacid dehydrogenase